MNILILLIPLALLLGFSFAISFIWAANKDQFEDTKTPAFRILENDENERTANERTH